MSPPLNRRFNNRELRFTYNVQQASQTMLAKKQGLFLVFFITLPVLTVLLGFPALCFAAFSFNSKKSPNDNAPLEILSDYASFDQTTGHVVHRGNVSAIQGSRLLKSESLVIHRNDHGKVDNIISEGVPATFEIVEDPKKPKVYGKANTLHYFPKENKIVLMSSAELTQNDNTIQATTITYYIDSGKLVTDSNEEGRTTVTIQSKNGHVAEKNNISTGKNDTRSAPLLKQHGKPTSPP